MAIAASVTFLLAAAYFVKLVYDSGWLTPERQLGLAALTGVVLIAGGVRLAALDRAYAAYPPAVGIVVLYLAIYAGQFSYGLLGPRAALVCVAAVSGTALWLSGSFGSSAYALLAVLGAYATPLLGGAGSGPLLDLVVYFSAWTLLFSFVALHEGRRLTYLIALYAALFGFDVAFRFTDRSDWLLAAVYQFGQFLVFSATAVTFSVRHEKPLRDDEAVAHSLALFYFYAIEYALIRQHAPAWAPPLALASVAAVLGAFALAYRRLGGAGELKAGATLVSAYAAVVTTHVVFFEWIPLRWWPWAALLLPVAAALLRQALGLSGAPLLPVALVSGVLFTLGFLRALVGVWASAEASLPSVLLSLYAAVLYGLYGFLQRSPQSAQPAPLALYGAHLAFLGVSVHVAPSGLALSICWAIFAVLLLVYAVRRGDRIVGQSSLVVFAASAIKVLLYDLSGSTPVVRVITLVVLSASLYAGGWLYQQMPRRGAAPS